MATVKCLFVGDFNSGKSALLRRIVDDVFEPTSPTVGVEFHTISMPHIEHKITAWNLAGAPRFQEILQLYYKNSQIVFVVVDASVPGNNVGKWVTRANTLCRDARVVIVFTKIDLPMNYTVREIELMKTHYRVFDCCMVSSKAMTSRDILATLGKVFYSVQPIESCLHDYTPHNGKSWFCCFGR